MASQNEFRSGYANAALGNMMRNQGFAGSLRGGGTFDQVKHLGKLAQAHRLTAKHVVGLHKAMDKSGEVTEKSTEKMKDLHDSLGDIQKRVPKLSKVFNQFSKDLDTSSSIAEKGISKISSVGALLTKSAGDVGKNAKEMIKSMAGIGIQADVAGQQTIGFVDKLKLMGVALISGVKSLRVLTVSGLAAAAAIEAIIEDSDLTDLRKYTDQLQRGSKNLEAFRQVTSATSLAVGAEVSLVRQRTIEASKALAIDNQRSKNLQDLVKTMIMVERVSGVAADDLLRIASTIQQIGGLAGDSEEMAKTMKSIAGMLVTLSRSTGVTKDQISALTSSITEFGISLESSSPDDYAKKFRGMTAEVSASLKSFSKQGYGDIFKRLNEDIAKFARSGDFEAVEQMIVRTMGKLSYENIVDMMDTGKGMKRYYFEATSTLKDQADILESMGLRGQRLNYQLSQMFGYSMKEVAQMRKINLADLEKETERNEKLFEKLDKVYGEFSSSWQGIWKSLSTSTQAMLMDIGAPIIEFLLKPLKLVADALAWVSNTFNNFGYTAKAFVSSLAVIGSAFLLLGFSPVALSIVTIITAIGFLTLTLGRFISWVSTNFPAVGKLFTVISGGISEATKTTRDRLSEIKSYLITTFQSFSMGWDSLRDDPRQALEYLRSTVNDVFLDIGNLWGKLKTRIFGTNIWKSAVIEWDTMVYRITSSDLWNDIVNRWKSMKESITSSDIYKKVAEQWGKIRDFITVTFDSFSLCWRSFGEDPKQAMRYMYETIKDAFTDIITSVKFIFSNLWSKLFDGRQIGESISAGLASVKDLIVSYIIAPFKEGINWIREKSGLLGHSPSEVAIDIAKGLFSGGTLILKALLYPFTSFMKTGGKMLLNQTGAFNFPHGWMESLSFQVIKGFGKIFSLVLSPFTLAFKFLVGTLVPDFLGSKFAKSIASSVTSVAPSMSKALLSPFVSVLGLLGKILFPAFFLGLGYLAYKYMERTGIGEAIKHDTVEAFTSISKYLKDVFFFRLSWYWLSAADDPKEYLKNVYKTFKDAYHDIGNIIKTSFSDFSERKKFPKKMEFLNVVDKKKMEPISKQLGDALYKGFLWGVQKGVKYLVMAFTAIPVLALTGLYKVLESLFSKGLVWDFLKAIGRGFKDLFWTLLDQLRQLFKIPDDFWLELLNEKRYFTIANILGKSIGSAVWEGLKDAFSKIFGWLKDNPLLAASLGGGGLALGKLGLLSKIAWGAGSPTGPAGAGYGGIMGATKGGNIGKMLSHVPVLGRLFKGSKDPMPVVIVEDWTKKGGMEEGVGVMKWLGSPAVMAVITKLIPVIGAVIAGYIGWKQADDQGRDTRGKVQRAGLMGGGALAGGVIGTMLAGPIGGIIGSAIGAYAGAVLDDYLETLKTRYPVIQKIFTAIADYAVKQWDQFLKDMQNIWSWITWIGSGIAALASGIASLFMGAMRYFQKIEEIGLKYGALAAIGKMILDGIVSVGKMLFWAITWPFQLAWSWLKGLFFGESPSELGLMILEGILSVGNALFDAITAPFTKAWEFIKGGASTVWGWITGNKGGDATGKSAMGGGAATGFPGSGTESIPSVAQIHKEWLREKVAGVWDWTKKLGGEGGKGKPGGMSPEMADLLRNMLKPFDLIESLKKGFSDLLDYLKEKFPNAASAVEKAIEKIKGFWEKVLDTRNFFLNLREQIFDKVIKPGGQVGKEMFGSTEGFTSTIKDLGFFLKQDLPNAASWVGEKIFSPISKANKWRDEKLDKWYNRKEPETSVNLGPDFQNPFSKENINRSPFGGLTSSLGDNTWKNLTKAVEELKKPLDAVSTSPTPGMTGRGIPEIGSGLRPLFYPKASIPASSGEIIGGSTGITDEGKIRVRIDPKQAKEMAVSNVVSNKDRVYLNESTGLPATHPLLSQAFSKVGLSDVGEKLGVSKLSKTTDVTTKFAKEQESLTGIHEAWHALAQFGSFKPEELKRFGDLQKERKSMLDAGDTFSNKDKLKRYMEVTAERDSIFDSLKDPFTDQLKKSMPEKYSRAKEYLSGRGYDANQHAIEMIPHALGKDKGFPFSQEDILAIPGVKEMVRKLLQNPDIISSYGNTNAWNELYTKTGPQLNTPRVGVGDVSGVGGFLKEDMSDVIKKVEKSLLGEGGLKDLGNFAKEDMSNMFNTVSKFWVEKGGLKDFGSFAKEDIPSIGSKLLEATKPSGKPGEFGFGEWWNTAKELGGDALKTGLWGIKRPQQALFQAALGGQESMAKGESFLGGLWGGAKKGFLGQGEDVKGSKLVEGFFDDDKGLAAKITGGFLDIFADPTAILPLIGKIPGLLSKLPGLFKGGRAAVGLEDTGTTLGHLLPESVGFGASEVAQSASSGLYNILKTIKDPISAVVGKYAPQAKIPYLHTKHVGEAGYEGVREFGASQEAGEGLLSSLLKGSLVGAGGMLGAHGTGKLLQTAIETKLPKVGAALGSWVASQFPGILQDSDTLSQIPASAVISGREFGAATVSGGAQPLTQPIAGMGRREFGETRVGELAEAKKVEVTNQDAVITVLKEILSALDKPNERKKRPTSAWSLPDLITDSENETGILEDMRFNSITGG
jgi:hypothetical protein